MTENDAGASPPPPDDDALLAALTDALAPPARSVPAERRDELRRLVAADAGPDTVRPLSAARSGRAERAMRSRRAVLLGGVAAGIGAVVGATAVLATDDDAQPEQAGPPTRPVAFASTPVGATASARTIDHAWGMEVMLDVQGLPAGSDYAVTYETAAGPVAAGGFRAVADVVMHCRFNATALRDQVDAVVVVHEGSGTEVLRGTLA